LNGRGVSDIQLNDAAFLAGDGVMARMMRAHDWSATPLGTPEAWPQALRTCVRLMLNTRHPIFMFWAPKPFVFIMTGIARFWAANATP
jgi:hypothetical protein